MSSIEHLKLFLNNGIQSLDSVDQFSKVLAKSLTDFSNIYQLNFPLILNYLPYEKESEMKTSHNLNNSFESTIKDMINQKLKFDIEVIEETEKFKEEYKLKSKKYINQIENLIQEIGKMKSDIENLKLTYDGLVEEAQKAERKMHEFKKELFVNLTMDEFNSVNMKYIEMRVKSETAENSYASSVKSYNYNIDQKKNELQAILSEIYKAEEAKSNFIHKISPQLVNLLYFFQDIILKCSSELNDTLSKTSTNFNKKLLQQNFNPLLDSDIFQKILFIQYDNQENITMDTLTNQRNPKKFTIKSPKRNLKIKSLKKLPDSFDLTISNNECIKDTLNKLLDNEIPNNISKIIEILHTKQGRNVFNLYLEQISSVIRINSIKAYEAICDIFYSYLTTIMLEKENAIVYLYNALVISRYISYKSSNEPTKFVYDHLKGHGVWQDLDIWNNLIERVIKIRIKEYDESYEKFRAVKEARLKENDPNKSIFSALQGVVKYIKKKSNLSQNNYDIGIKNAVFEVLWTFCFYLSVYGNSREESFRILSKFGNYYKLTDLRIAELYVEYTSIKPLIFDNKKIRNTRFKNRLSKIENINFKNNLFIILNSISFSNKLKTLRNLLLLSINVNETIFIEIYRHLLIKLNIKIPLTMKIKIWERIAQINLFDIQNFNELNEIVEKESTQLKEINDVINLDVRRSYNHITKIKQESLKKILKLYAYYDKSIQYCQGMNFVVGFLILVFQDEKTVFQILNIIMNNYSMRKVYMENMPLLQVLFFTLDQLIAFYYPDLHSHFKFEGISASYYSSSWFLTLFTSSLQYSKDGSIPVLLEAIWDIFLLYNLKGLIKVSLFLIDMIKDKLEDQKFDIAMINLSEIFKSNIFQSEEMTLKLKTRISDWKITGSMLKKIEDDFWRIRNEPIVMAKLLEAENSYKLYKKMK